MKYYTLLLICFVTSLAYSQKGNGNDTLFLKDNTSYIGDINKEDFKQYQFIVSGTDKIVYILKSDIVRVGQKFETLRKEKESTNFYTINGVNYSTNRFDTLSLDGLRSEVKQIKLQTIVTSEYVKKAGQFGIAGGVLSLGGTILSVVGAVTGEPALTYVGAGLAGTGLILNFVAFGNLIKAGKRTR